MATIPEETLEYTGERMVPSVADDATFWEHIERYRYAAKWVAGKRTLDIACGEGYGAAALVAAGAADVVGVDVAADACEHARRRYGINTKQGSAESIPLSGASADVVVSFETIEHVPKPELFIQECERVLAPGGLLVISTPNPSNYLRGCQPNPYHCSEMSVEAFIRLIGSKFKVIETAGQVDAVGRLRRIRGLGRLIRLFRRLFDPVHSLPLSDERRRGSIELIRQERAFLERLTNPYIVRDCAVSHLSRYRYVVAVAQRCDKRL